MLRRRYGSSICCFGILTSLGLAAAAMAQPANDLCAGAVALTPGVPYADTNALATSTNDGPITTACQAGSNVKNGVWFSLSTGPTGAGFWRISTCGSPAHDTVLVVYQAGVDCTGIGSATNFLACNDDAGPDCTGTRASLDTALAANSTYLIRLQTWGGGTSGPYSILAQSLVATGVCCNNASGACTPAFNGGACPTGTTTGTGLTCAPSPCVAAGTCCNNTTGVCSAIFGGVCPTGTTAGLGTTCTPSPCVAVATCCNNTSGLCSTIFGGACPTGTTLTGVGNTCTPSPCPASQACCSGTACTVVLVSTGCGTGVGQGAGTTCSPSNPCFTDDNCATTTLVATVGTQTGTNVNATQSAALLNDPLIPYCTQTTWVTGAPNNQKDVFWRFVAPATADYNVDTCGSGFDTIMSIHSGCPVTQANLVSCNDDSTSGAGNVACSTGSRSRIPHVTLTASATYYIRVFGYNNATGAITLNINTTGTTGACCLLGVCTVTDAAGCTGAYTDGASCSPNPCGAALGVCCRGATCSTAFTGPIDCAATLVGGQTAGAQFVPAATACNSGPISNSPCCFADYNKANNITVQDIFDFLSDWFAGSPYANTGGNGTMGPLTVQNIFDFLSDWFAGGC